MKTNEIKILLQKYYDGLTSSLEEAELERYFLGNDTDPDLDADKLHFQALASMRDEEIVVPEDLESSVLQTLKKVQGNRVPGSRKFIYMAVSIAASLLLMVSTYVFLLKDNSSSLVTDPKVAYAESRQALELVSKYFNQGTAHLSGLSKINEAMQPLNKLNSLDKAAKSISAIGKLPNQK